MRVLITTDAVGGVWTFSSELSEGLLLRGHAVALLSFGPAPSDEKRAWADVQKRRFGPCFDFSVSESPLEWAECNEAALTAGEPALHRVAERFLPDLLLSNQFCFGAVRLPIPRVVVAHSDVLSWAGACRPAALAPSRWLRQYCELVTDGLMAADAVIAPTHAALDDLARKFPFPQRSSVIPNGRRVTLTEPPPRRKLQAISAGRLWDRAKGLDILDGCDLPLPVLLAGETRFGDESLPEVSSNVRLLGRLAAADLQAAFQGSALYLCTSRYEPFGLAPLEAALCGCALALRDLPSLREVWGDAALYFEDARTLGAILRLLAGDHAALEAAQRNAQRRAAGYTVERMTDAYLAIFAAACSGHGTLHAAV